MFTARGGILSAVLFDWYLKKPAFCAHLHCDENILRGRGILLLFECFSWTESYIFTLGDDKEAGWWKSSLAKRKTNWESDDVVQSRNIHERIIIKFTFFFLLCSYKHAHVFSLSGCRSLPATSYSMQKRFPRTRRWSTSEFKPLNILREETCIWIGVLAEQQSEIWKMAACLNENVSSQKSFHASLTISFVLMALVGVVWQLFASVLLDFLIFGEITAAELWGCLKSGPTLEPHKTSWRWCFTGFNYPRWLIRTAVWWSTAWFFLNDLTEITW